MRRRTFDTSIKAIAAAIDGQYALTLKQVKIVVHPSVLQFMYGLIKANTAVTLVDYLMMQSGGIMCTSNMPTHASDIYPTILCKTGPGRGDNAVGKVWGGGIQIIRDEITQAGAGQVIITARSLYDFRGRSDRRILRSRIQDRVIRGEFWRNTRHRRTPSGVRSPKADTCP